MDVVELVLTKKNFGSLSTLVELLDNHQDTDSAHTEMVIYLETRSTGLFYANAVWGKMKVFMTCKVAFRTAPPLISSLFVGFHLDTLNTKTMLWSILTDFK